MIGVVPPELIILAVAVAVVVTVAVGISLLVSRYGATREDKGEAGEKVEAYERAIIEAEEREAEARKQRSLSHAEWKRQGAKRRKQRATRPGRGSK